MMMRSLGQPLPQLSTPDDLLYWHGDMF
jgi:hypothetical protein